MPSSSSPTRKWCQRWKSYSRSARAFSELRTPPMVRILAVLNVLSVVVMIFALCLFFPLAWSYILGDAAKTAYDEAILLTASVGVLLWLMTRRRRRELQPRDGFLLVALVWTVLPAFATLPLMFYLPQLSFTHAYFETVSGLTTTGATVLSGLDALPPSINIWRTFLVWIGGMGVIVLAVAILPLLGVGGSQIYKAETPGPMKDTKLTPRIAETAKGLWLVYFMITVACLLCYRIAGMNWLDAMMHAFSTMGLGGFSSHDASFAYWNSPAIAMVPVKLGNVPVENNIIFAVLAFILVYNGAVIAMTMLLAASGLDIITAFSAVIACINNTGPGLNQVGPATTYAGLNAFQIWVCTIAMLLGRLELFTLLVVFTPGFWRK